MEIAKVMAIVNPWAGIGNGLRCYKKIIKWKDAAAKEGLKVDGFLTEKEGDRCAVNLAKNAVQNGYGLIVSCGGDGTLNEVVNGTMGSDVPILSLRVGNGNDFAKAVGTPKNIEEALGLIKHGKIESFDVGKVNNRYFINVFGVGFDAKISRYAEILKQKLPLAAGNLLYLIALIKEFFGGLEYFDLGLTMIDKENSSRIIRAKDVTLISIANGPTCGGIFRLAPEANPQDGVLDICLINKINRLKILRFLPKAIKGTHLSLKEVMKESDGRLPRISFLTVASLKGQPLPCQMDGEILPAEKEYRISVFPKAQKVLVPRSFLALDSASVRTEETAFKKIPELQLAQVKRFRDFMLKFKLF